MTDRELLPALFDARERFLALVAEVRPELHRYCARMTGSVFDGEDVVQDALAKAYFALSQMAEPPRLRPWLFRIAHNAAMDHLRRYERRNVEIVTEVPEEAYVERDPDPILVEMALASFVALPPVQRSAVVLKDILGHSLEQTAETMGTTLLAVKAALVRARANLAASVPSPVPAATTDIAHLKRYAALFNARDWNGLRALLADDARLDVVSRAQRRGRATGEYYSRYEELAGSEFLRVEVGSVAGVQVLAFFRHGAARPAYFARLQWEGDRVATIQDFRYASYVADEAPFTRHGD